jgi:hypothetical protein
LNWYLNKAAFPVYKWIEGFNGTNINSQAFPYPQKFWVGLSSFVDGSKTVEINE